MLDNPLSFWNLNTLEDLAKYSKFIEGEKSFYKFLSHYKTLEKITRHPLSVYLLGDSESYFFIGKPQSGKSYFRGYTSKHSNEEVAGFLPSDFEGEGFIENEIPYLYDIQDINEGRKLLTIPSDQILNILGKNHFLVFLEKLKSLVKFFKRSDIKDSIIFKGIFKKLLFKIDNKNVDSITDKLFPIPVRSQISGFSETQLMYAGSLDLNYSPDYKIISYGDLTRPAVAEDKHRLELFNFKIDYKNMILFKIGEILYKQNFEEVEKFINLEIESIVTENTSKILTTNFIGSYIDKINKINLQTDLIEFYVGNPLQTAFCYDYSSYITDINKSVILNIKDVSLKKYKKPLDNYNKPAIELVESVWTEILKKIDFNMVGDNIERDLFSTSDLVQKIDYLVYSFSNQPKEGINLNRYFAFPPFIEIGINVKYDNFEILNEEAHTIEETQKILDYRQSSITAFKKPRELTFPPEKSILYFSLEQINTFGITRLDVNRCMTLKLLKNNVYLKKYLKNYLKNLIISGKYHANFIGGFINNYSTYTYHKDRPGELKSVVSVTNSMLSLLILPELYKSESIIQEFIEKISNGIMAGIKQYEKEGPKHEDLLFKDKYNHILCFIYRLLLSSKLIWENLLVFKNLLYVKNADGYDTLFNYINRIAIKRWGAFKYSSIEKLIEARYNLFKEGVESLVTLTEKGVQIKKDVIESLGHLMIETDYISILREIKQGKLEIIVDIPGNMLNKIYDMDKIMSINIRNIFDYIYFDFSNPALESVSGIDMMVSFLYFTLGLEKVSILIYNDFKMNKNINFIYRLFDRLLFRNQKEMVKKIIGKIEGYDHNLYQTLSNKYRRI